MGSQDESPGCANQTHVQAPGNGGEPSSICSCPAGLIHMDDCPVTLGLECIHFRPLVESPACLSLREQEDLHDRLMRDYLARPYFHRVRSLAPGQDAWHRRQAELAQRYPPEPPEPDDAPDEVSEEYHTERARLLVVRRQREQVRQEREEAEKRAKAARARERAERAFKEAEARAARQQRSRPRPRRVKSDQRPREAGDGPPAAAGSKRSKRPRRRRRRRRRNSGGEATS